MEEADGSWQSLLLHGRMWPKWMAWFSLVAASAPAIGVWWLLAGLAAFPVLEYAAHRFLFHPRRASWRAAHTARLHAGHHVRPRALEVLFLPASVVALTPIIWITAWLLTGFAAATSLSLGIVSGLLVYEAIHLACHQPNATPGLGFFRRRHMLHHYRDAHAWFGVTAPILDDAFGSRGRR